MRKNFRPGNKQIYREAERSGVKVSIIVPCYKVEKYLKRCLDSLLAQSLSEMEIICVNDGSPDNCLMILKEYERRFPDRIVVIDKENEGVWKARKDGIAKATGEYIGFLDPDDYVKRDFAKRLYQAAKAQDADVACCGFDRVNEETGKAYSREMTKLRFSRIDLKKDPGLLLEVNAAIWNKLFRAEVLRKMDDFSEIPRAFDDLVFAHLIYPHVNSIVFVPRSLVYYTVRSGSVVSSIDPDCVPGIYRSMQKLRSLYARKYQGLLTYLDAEAFLHLGVSLMHRLSSDRNVDLNAAIGRNMRFLNRTFPRWKKNPYIRISYVLRHRGANGKIWLMRCLYALHLFRLFLSVYKAMIDRFGVDVKW